MICIHIKDLGTIRGFAHDQCPDMRRRDRDRAVICRIALQLNQIHRVQD